MGYLQSSKQRRFVDEDASKVFIFSAVGTEVLQGKDPFIYYALEFAFVFSKIGQFDMLLVTKNALEGQIVLGADINCMAPIVASLLEAVALKSWR